MDEQIQNISRSPVWYRRVLNVLWLIILVFAIDELVHIWLGYGDALPGLFKQGTIMIIIMSVLELISRNSVFRNDYLLIGTSVLIVSLIVSAHPDMAVATMTLFAPLFTSIIFFRKSLVVFAAVSSAAAFGLLYVLFPSLHSMFNLNDAVTVMLIQLFAAYLALIAMNRAYEILSNLRQLHKAKQDLLVKTIIMDKLFKMDALTELYNHKTFHEYLEKLVEQSETNHLPLQLAVIDIDNFKRINDTYGHWAGDNILMRVGAILRSGITADDFVARYGGEEFAIIFTDKHLEQSYDILERIRSEIAGTPHEELGFKSVTVSIGLEEYKKGQGKELLFKNADASLYTAKKRGKNQIACTELTIKN